MTDFIHATIAILSSVRLNGSKQKQIRINVHKDEQIVAVASGSSHITCQVFFARKLHDWISETQRSKVWIFYGEARAQTKTFLWAVRTKKTIIWASCTKAFRDGAEIRKRFQLDHIFNIQSKPPCNNIVGNRVT